MDGLSGSGKCQAREWTEISLRDKQWTGEWMGCRNKGRKNNGQRSQMDKRRQRMEDWADSHGGRRKVGGGDVHKTQGEIGGCGEKGN